MSPRCARRRRLGVPTAGTSSGRVHSRYRRRLADIAVGGQPIAIDLEVRRFFCDNGACGKKTFAEQVEGLTFRYGRRTVLLQRALEQVALALGGRAGERLAVRLSMPVSGSTLLRQIRRLELPKVQEVEVLGVDEFAFRRGRWFGTILIDMNSRRPVDVLPDHTADTFAAWLKGRDHVRTICRDRGGSFAEGAQRALPGIPQIADRWHILHNLATAVEKAVRRHRPCLQPPSPARDRRPSPQGEERVETRYEQNTRARWQQIRPRYQKGMTIDAISKLTGFDRTTVRRYARAASLEELVQPRLRRRTDLDRHKPYLLARWTEGCDNAQTLRAEIAARGYTGSRKTVRRFLNSLGESPEPQPPSAPSLAVADVVRWIIGRPENQSESARQQLKGLCDRCEHVATTNRLARKFATILRRRDGHRLADWLEEVEQHDIKDLHVFANGVRKDLAAVTAGLTVSWNSGAVEGHVNRIKMLKRQHYGRAGFDLLKRRILLTS
ncbi:ISL3 family transposase [Streptomyces sp. NBC_00201]|uniref:ISL3 family transposase n=1 Tax=Streptomyces sp. NBC_00201 TaxID=2975679 RepID=UPI00225971BC|nr:ISL3 family transposase [Streptomyces sp. NBC_00201]MCX5247141.1 ISL3 family transposase [Streptomyces sp. NBC_00201]